MDPHPDSARFLPGDLQTILVAKDGKPWARLKPLETDRPRRQPGLLRGQLQRPPIDALFATLPLEELEALDATLPSCWRHPSCWPPTIQQPRSS